MRTHPIATGLGLGLLFALFYFWSIKDVPFYTKGEPREATVVWEIVHTNEWILPLRNGHIIPSKPPLFHWLGALCALVAGEVSEFTVRFPSAALALLGVLLTYSAGTMLWGVEAGLIAGLILGTSFEWVRAATTARVDMTLTVCMVMAFLFFFFLYRRRRVSRAEALGFFVLLGLATLAKGPVGMLLPILTIVIFLCLQRDLKFLRRLHVVSGGVVCLLIAGAWYGLAWWKGGEAFFMKQIMKENVLRFLASDEVGAGHEHPFYFFVPNLFLGMVPWSFFFPPLAMFLYRRRYTWARDGFLYFIVWTATVFLFYSASSSKRSVYILPLYPAVALLLGAWWQELKNDTAVFPRSLWRLLQGGGYVGVMTIGLFIIVVAAQLLGFDSLGVIRPFLHPKDQGTLPFFSDLVSTHPVAFGCWFAVVGPAALMLLRAIRNQRWGRVFAALFTFAFSTLLLVYGVFQPTVAVARTFRPFMARVVNHVKDTPLFFYGTFDSGAVFYAGRRIPFYALSERTAGGPYFLLMWEEEWEKLAATAEGGWQVVDISEGSGPKGNHHLVLVYIPEGTPPPPENPMNLDEVDTL
jgi:4-amino-4-deoxy-L-arabinose transferase-like glycosyltransferase